MSAKRKVLIDCDPGNDDAESILMALSFPDVEVVAITTVCGNIGAKQCALNALRVLQTAKRLDIPVYVGCTKPLLGDELTRHEFHGTDGFGDVPDASAPDDSVIQSDHGVEALIRLSKLHAGELTLVCLGPLTNIAMAIRCDTQIGHRLKGCYLMGGNYQGKGNITMSAEFNFFWDPEAAYVVLNQLGCHMTVLPWETSLAHALGMDFHSKLRSVATPKSELLRKIDEHSIRVLRKYNISTFALPDELGMAAFLNSDVIKTSVDVYATVEISGKYTRGQMVVDWTNLMKKDSNVTIVTDVHDDVFHKLLYQASDAPFPST